MLVARGVGRIEPRETLGVPSAALICTFLFGPVLTYMLLRAEHVCLGAYSRWRQSCWGCPHTVELVP